MKLPPLQASRRTRPPGLTRPVHIAVTGPHGKCGFAVDNPLFLTYASDEELLRALRIAEEFGLPNPWIKGSGYEYRIADYLKSQSVSPDSAPHPAGKTRYRNPGRCAECESGRLRHWYLAPEKRLSAVG